MEISAIEKWQKGTAVIAISKTHKAGGTNVSPAIMAYPDLKDEQLMDLVVTQDQKAFKELFERYSKRVFNLTYSYVNDYHYAEDISEDVFITVYNKSKTFKKESSFSTWVYRITVNASISHIRKHKKDMVLTDIENAEDIITEELEKPDENYKKELGAKILLMLPENQKTAFILSQKDGLRYKEISAIMKISEKAVESLIYRAKENLRRIIKDVRSNKKLKEGL